MHGSIPIFIDERKLLTCICTFIKKWKLRFSRKILLKDEGHLKILEQKMIEQRCLNGNVCKSFCCSEIALS